MLIIFFTPSNALAANLAISLNAEPSATGDVDLYWYAEDSVRGKIILEYGNAKNTYNKQYFLNVNQATGMITLVDLNPNTTYYYRLRQGDNYTEEHQFKLMHSIAADQNNPIQNNNQESSASSSPSPILNNFTSSCIAGAIINNPALYNKLKGKIILRAEALGEAYYVNPLTPKIHCLGRPQDAFDIMRGLSIGITNQNISRIPIAYYQLSGNDADDDGLSDIFEDAVWSRKDLSDTDGDGLSDKENIILSQKPIGLYNNINLDNNFSAKHAGKIFLQVQNNGEAWYLWPQNNQRYFLGRPNDALNIMRGLGLGISEIDFNSL